MARSRNKTKRDKAKNKGGRPKIDCDRTPSGRPSRAKGVAPTIESLIHREAVVEGAFDKPADSLPGHALGILLANKWLNTAQYDAALKFERLNLAFRQAIAASHPHAKVASYGDMSHGSAIFYDDGDESEAAKAARERDQAVTRAYLDALSVLDGQKGARTASDVLSCVLQVCLHDTLPWWFCRVPASVGFEDAPTCLLNSTNEGRVRAVAMHDFRACLDNLAGYWRERRAA